MRYLLPCDQCGEKLAIDANQAGRQIVCQCGATLVVPSFRAIRELETTGEAPLSTARRRKWNPARGLTFASGLMTIVAGLFIAVMAGLYWYHTDTTEYPGPDLSQAAQELDALDAVEILEIWKDMEENGMGPYVVPQHIMAQQWAERCRWIMLIGLAVVAVGLALSAGPVITSKIRRS
jgi:hypothetical protein